MAADPLTKNAVSDLLDYDMSDGDDPFKDIDDSLRIRDDKATLSPRAQKRKADHDKENDILGLDEEVKITKKRKPIAKLDEARLLSQPGIPKLRALARSGEIAKKLRLKGKGHEFSDAAKLLNYYQLWLDNLYPRAKFADGLQLVEKAGHSKRMQAMRREWIDEGKPGYARDKKVEETYEEFEGERGTNGRQTVNQETGTDRDNGSGRRASVFGNAAESDELFFPDTNHNGNEKDDNAAPEEDELEALIHEQASKRISKPPPASEPNSEGEDDLDALLAEQDSRTQHDGRTQKKQIIVPETHVEEEDDLDALLAEHDAAQSRRTTITAPVGKAKSVDEDDDDLDALLAEQDTARDSAAMTSMEPEGNIPTAEEESDGDDLDALLAEHESKPQSERELETKNDEAGLDRWSSPVPMVGGESDGNGNEA